ncbi:LppX_LprAFG lipoprotein [Solicola gregarius]|uniref:LppX_LprAFG lipoprotein n=1 Tax=Solicola gregarius TaxID=2908642 RepID=A0AA46YLX5_9ACTN|nr:LppX_LprAFG lipoprotein [Solicola gregarius]UYM05278.1 LppX_LprAFG lipoprotein [Solicola gregarius]
MLRRTSAVSAATLVLVAISACGGGDDSGSGGDPQERLEAARKVIDDAESIELSLETSDLPSDVEGIISAEGIGTHDPAFDGTAQVRAFGITGEVPVVAVDGEVYFKLPFKSDYETFDVSKYDAPDPADLLSTDDGLTSMITSLEDVEAGETELDDETKVTPIDGTLTGKSISTLFPSVDDSSVFDVSFRVDDDDVLRDATISGPFYPDADDLTYTIALTASDESVDISAPS